MSDNGNTRMESMNLLSDTIERARNLRETLGTIGQCDDTCMEIIQYRILTINRGLSELEDMYHGK